MEKKNYSKEIKEYQKRIEELKLEEAKEKLAAKMDVLRDEILRDSDAVVALTTLPKDEVKEVAKVIAAYMTSAIATAEPAIAKMRERKAKQSAARKARRDSAAEKSDDVEVDNAPPVVEQQAQQYANRGQWNGQN